MKNYYLFKQTKIVLLFVFFLAGMSSFAQQVEKNPMADLEKFKSDAPQMPINYTATKVTMSKDALPTAKDDFIKEHGADFFYVYTDSKGKTVSKEEVEAVLKKENEKNPNPNSKIVTNPKK
jgi:hypothetical protein